MKLYGCIYDKQNHPIKNTQVEVKAETFQTIYSTQSDARGRYEIDLPAGKYPFIIAVKDYAERCLEYWCQNLTISADTQLDMRFDTLEVYGLNAFRVKGGYPSLHIYFRPMSLAKFRAGEKDPAPVLREIRVSIDDQPVDVLHTNAVSEFIGKGALTAYLIQTTLPDPHAQWRRIDVEITDEDGNFGMATLFS